MYLGFASFEIVMHIAQPYLNYNFNIHVSATHHQQQFEWAAEPMEVIQHV